MSQTCQQRTHAAQQIQWLFDHLGRAVLHLGFPAGWFGCGWRRAARRPSRTVETSQWRCISGIEWHCDQEPRRLDAEGFAEAINLGQEMALQELHSKIRQTIASAVRRRGNK